MDKEINHELYESPEIEIIEMNSVQVICQSVTNNDLGDWGYNDNDL